MFRKAVIKMTLLYLLIIMSISLFFSLNLYRISTQEIQGSLRRQQNIYEHVGPFMHDFLNDPAVAQQRDAQVLDTNHQVMWQLLYTNVAILVLGGGLSYMLALFTLKPIEDAHEAQSRFTGDASHELRSPLASMKTEIEVALRDPKLTREEAIEILESNLEEVERLGSLSNYLLKLARDEDEPLSLAKTDLAKTVSQVVGTYDKNAVAKKIKVKSAIPAGTHVLANQESLVEILAILLDNAIKYSEPQTEVIISAVHKNQHTEVSVTDQGQGIAEDEIGHIFERFYRADGSRTKRKVEGYGLGLALAQKLAEANHAQITVKSQPGQGSTFKFSLPAKS